MKYSVKDKIDEGWSIQIYGRDRRLLCSLYPSHGWTFLAGFVVGLLLALSMVGHHLTQASSFASPSSSPTSPNPHEPLLQVD
jgi:tetrahydromethanopterin S-methyltransferase subunit F